MNSLISVRRMALAALATWGAFTKPRFGVRMSFLFRARRVARDPGCPAALAMSLRHQRRVWRHPSFGRPQPIVFTPLSLGDRQYGHQGGRAHLAGRNNMARMPRLMLLRMPRLEVCKLQHPQEQSMNSAFIILQTIKIGFITYCENVGIH